MPIRRAAGAGWRPAVVTAEAAESKPWAVTRRRRTRLGPRFALTHRMQKVPSPGVPPRRLRCLRELLQPLRDGRQKTLVRLRRMAEPSGWAFDLCHVSPTRVTRHLAVSRWTPRLDHRAHTGEQRALLQTGPPSSAIYPNTPVVVWALTG